MADFLASFNFGQGTATAPHDSACHSIDDIQSQLRNNFEAKVTPTRAEHISLSLELRGSANIALPETENDSLDGHGSSESLAGGQPEQPPRIVSVSDALVRQTDDPLLQRTIAKHILRAMSDTDNSNWIVRDMSRALQGWSFTYICKSSHQYWSRQNAKTTPACLIGEFSLPEPDPMLMGRPAFDCRGSVLIAFERSSRSISIRYEHTPIHWTVAQLKELYPSPARQLGPGAQRQLQQKTPMKSKKSKNKNKENENENAEQADAQTKPKKKRKTDASGEGETGSRPKKQKKRKKSEAMDAAPKQLQQELAHDPSQEASQVQSRGEPTVDAGSSHQSSNQPQPSSNLHPVNVDANEAVRRLVHAKKLLEDAGIDPTTLSSDQMHIFSNQLPELQRDSLALLSKYGAQHIVIVPPKDKSGAGPRSQSSTPIQTQQAAPPPPAPTTRGITDDAPANAGAESSEQALLEAAASALSTVAQSSQKKKKRVQGKSRLACSCCKNRRVKCPKERPVCSECQTNGQICEYPPAKPRKKKKTTSEPVVIDDEEDEEQDEQEEEDAPDEEDDVDTSFTDAARQQPLDSHTAPIEEQDTSQSQMPVAGMLRPLAQQAALGSYPAQSSYYQSAPVTTASQPEPSRSRYPNPTATQDVTAHSSWVRPEMQSNHAHRTSTAVAQAEQNPKPTRSISPNRSRRDPKEMTAQSRWRLPDSKPKSAAGGWGSHSTTHSHSHPHSRSSATNWIGDQDTQSYGITNNERTSHGAGLYSHQVPATSSHLQSSTFQTSNDNNFWPQHSQASAVHQSQPARHSPSMVAGMHAHSRTSPFQGINSHQRTTPSQTHQSQAWADNTQGRDASLSGVNRSTDVYHQNYYGTLDMNPTNRYT